MLQATSRRNQCPEYPARSSLSRRFCGIHHVRLHNLMPSQIEKLEAHASHLLDAFIRLTERYSLLDPMLFDSEVPKSRGSGAQARGFLTLRHSLFLSCSQDIAKLTLDSDKRTPSIKSLIAAFDESKVNFAMSWAQERKSECLRVRNPLACAPEPRDFGTSESNSIGSSNEYRSVSRMNASKRWLACASSFSICEGMRLCSLT